MIQQRRLALTTGRIRAIVRAYAKKHIDPARTLEPADIDECWRSEFAIRVKGMGHARCKDISNTMIEALQFAHQEEARRAARRAQKATARSEIPFGPELRLTNAQQDAVRSWGQDNLEVLREITEADVNELWRVVFEKKSKILSADEKAALKRAGAAELRRLHLEQRPTAPGKASGQGPEPYAKMSPLPPAEGEQHALVKLGDATRMLAEVRDAESAKYVMDVAAAAKVYAKKARLGAEAIAYAEGIKLDAERRLGQYLRDTERAPGGRPVAPSPTKTRSKPEQVSPGRETRSESEQVSKPKPLAELGVTRKLASEAQRLVDLPDDVFAEVKLGKVKLGAALRDQRKATLPDRIAAIPRGKYRVIYADPPWQYSDDRSGVLAIAHTAADRAYPTMPTSKICEMGEDVRAGAADDAVLFMWATCPLLEDALEVMRAWSFSYKQILVWNKEQRGPLGNYHDASAELLLVGTRGSCTPENEEAARAVRQVQTIARAGARHSAKPEAFRELIDRLYPSGPRIELFRRGDAPPGWVVWGNEAESGGGVA